MNYEEYQTARDAAWKLHIACGINELPIDVKSVCDRMGYHLRTYADGARMIAAFGLNEQMSRSDGFTTMYKNRYYIFYSTCTTPQRQRFTVCHEIGHIQCGHLVNGKYTTLNREPNPKDIPIEQMGNVFASRFLAPACILHELDATTPQQISRLCGISLQSATFRAERMQKLRDRGAFYRSPLEQQVFQQFRDFLNQR